MAREQDAYFEGHKETERAVAVALAFFHFLSLLQGYPDLCVCPECYDDPSDTPRAPSMEHMHAQHSHTHAHTLTQTCIFPLKHFLQTSAQHVSSGTSLFASIICFQSQEHDSPSEPSKERPGFSSGASDTTAVLLFLIAVQSFHPSSRR